MYTVDIHTGGKSLHERVKKNIFFTDTTTLSSLETGSTRSIFANKKKTNAEYLLAKFIASLECAMVAPTFM